VQCHLFYAKGFLWLYRKRTLIATVMLMFEIISHSKASYEDDK